MVTSLDVFAIKERVRDIIKNDTVNLFSSTPTDDTKFRLVEAGAPDLDKALRGPFPRLWVTNQKGVQDSMKRVGTQDTAASKTSPLSTEHTVFLKIVFLVHKKNSEKSEEDSDDFVKKILEKLKSDTKLSDPDIAGTDLKADEVLVDKIIDMNLQTGKPVNGREIYFRVIKTTGG